mgnify:CR=1 FL=1
MNRIETHLQGVHVFETPKYKDTRGSFTVPFNLIEFREVTNFHADFIQDNLSRSKKGVLRGLHYQLNYPQGKLISVKKGRVIDFAVDIRMGSPTFGKSQSFIIDDVKHQSVYIPEGFAHGFYVESGEAVFSYKCTDSYYPEDEHGINWNDSDLKLSLSDKKPLVSEKDQLLPRLKDIDKDLLPVLN